MLRMQGQTYRDIAATLGISATCARRYVDLAGYRERQPAAILGADGKMRPSRFHKGGRGAISQTDPAYRATPSVLPATWLPGPLPPADQGNQGLSLSSTRLAGSHPPGPSKETGSSTRCRFPSGPP
jgi:hypothetical protein